MKALKILIATALMMPAVSFAQATPDQAMCGALTQMFNSLPKSPAQLQDEFVALQSELDEAKLPELRKLEAELARALDLDRQVNEACAK